MNKLLYAIGGIAAFIGLDRALSSIYKMGLKEGHERGHMCMLEAMRQSPTFREAAESMPPPMHTDN